MDHPLIKKLEGLASLSAEEKRVLVETASHTTELPADQDVVSEDEHPTECRLILDGWLCRYKLLTDGKRQIIGFQIAGDLCDLSGFVLGRMDHSVGTITPAKVGVISHRTLQNIIEEYPHIGRALWQETLIDASISREWVANIGSRSAYQRVAHMVCEMGLRLQAVGRAQDGSFEWPITHKDDIADATGLAPVHVNRIMQQLRAEGLIALAGKSGVVPDWEALRQAGTFKPDYLFVGLNGGNQSTRQPIG